jgi:hypothetical protein
MPGDPAALEKAYSAPRRVRAPYLKKVNAINWDRSDKSRIESGEFLIWKDKDYHRVLERMKSEDKTISEACAGDNVPGTCAFYAFARKNADFNHALNETCESLTFATQARGDRLGERFRREGAALRLAGLTSKQIAKRLGGMHYVTVEKYLAGTPFASKTHCPQGHLYPQNGPRKCKLCNTIQARERYRQRREMQELTVDDFSIDSSLSEAPIG